eukprot:6555921-Prymnesium_polylepis.1
MEDCCSSSHLQLMREWGRRASADPHRWALVLEDDVAVHPALRPANLAADLDAIVRAAARNGHSFVYLGSCAPTCNPPNETASASAAAPQYAGDADAVSFGGLH